MVGSILDNAILLYTVSLFFMVLFHFSSTEHILALDVCRLANPGHQQEFVKTAECENFPLVSHENVHSLQKFEKFPSMNGLSCRRNTVSYDFAFSDYGKLQTESTREIEHKSSGHTKDETIYQKTDGVVKTCVSMPGNFKDDALCHSGYFRHNESRSNILDSGVSSEVVSMATEIDNGFFERSNDSLCETGFPGGFFSILSPIRGIVSNYDVLKQPRNKDGSYKDLSASMCNEGFLETDHRRNETIISTMVLFIIASNV